ncbi:MAG: JAB domain-containing protein [Verrucomicrobia bacterium]|nr:JAB domain-containing protein [Verrucomicrobiota bacterium]
MPSLPRDKAAQLVSSLRLAGVALGEERSRLLMDTPLAVTELCAEMRFLSHKSLRVVLVNTKQEPIKVVSVSQGMLDEALAHPREVFKSVVAFSAFALVLVHNHPAAIPPLPRQICGLPGEAGKVLQLQLVDHVIVGSPAQALVLDQVKEKPLTRS